MNKAKKEGNMFWTVILAIASLAWIYPVVMILFNSLKQENHISTGTAFKLPTAET